ncbi:MULTISPECIES: hypothetical protein [Arthrobacter]|uniref:Uncharacterized protein n=1 Tax=Arthrobacter terricola TaxID=2547396 RepID=A0A4R5KMK1_9MICC|nr:MULTISPECIES: hypothetical protein [Arthrobacter]MBT8160986.1 hypothetical protein [Arthrobacter sp. GN70]TDF96849.1 hypothetical protein E1809_08995 [Arthrobacter terricola]
MSTVGDLTNNSYADSQSNYANQVACVLTMPANGWITSASVIMGGLYTNPWSALALWASNGVLLWSGPGFSAGTGRALQTQSVANLRVGGGAAFYAGFWRDPNADAIWGLDGSVATNWGAQSTPGSGGPSNFTNSIAPYGPGQLSASVNYVANAAPNAGSWQSPTPSGAISDTNPTFSGTTPQNPADAAYDYVGQVWWQITRTDSGVLVADQKWSVNAAIPSWSKKPSDFGISLLAGVQYSVTFAYSDSWGAWSGWSAAQTFTANAGPNAPAPTAPTGKLTTITGVNFTATYTHPSSLSAQNVQVQVLDPSGRTVFQDSGVVAKTVAPGASYTVAQWFPSLAWGSAYTWWTRAQDTSGVWGPWSSLTAFTTDTAPNAPIPSAPGMAAIISSGSVVLKAAFSTPDGSNVTSLIWDLFDVTAGAEVPGYPATVTGSFTSGATQTRDVTSALVVGHAYEWRAQGSDGTLTGAWSPYWTFTYTTPPSVTVTAPAGGAVEASATATVTINYGGSAAKAYDRTLITDTTGGGTAIIYDSGNIAGARTTWGLPFSTIQNGHSYSISVIVTDVNGLYAVSAPVAFSASWTITATPELQLLVAGQDRTANFNQDQWSLSQDWGRQGDTASIILTDEFKTAPNFALPPMSTVELRDLNLGVLLFGGVATQPKSSRSGNLMTWTLMCSSPAVYLQNRIVSSDYSGWTADAIVRDMLAQADCGITANHVEAGPIIDHFKGLNHTVTQALQKLCHLASTTSTYGWWVDGGSDLHFAATTQADAQPSGVVLTDRVTSAATTMTGFYETDSQTYYQWDSSSLKTRVLVQGGSITRTTTEQFVGDGTSRTFHLSYPVQTNPLNAVVQVNGVAAPVSDQTDATTPWLLVQGAPGVWSLSTQPGGAPPASGAIVAVTYNYVTPVVAQAQSSAGIAAATGPNQGLFDTLITDSTLDGLEPAQARALRELEEYALSQERVVLVTTEDWPGWLTVGQSFRFQNGYFADSQNNYTPGIDDTFLVIQMRASGVAGGFRTCSITGVRV